MKLVLRDISPYILCCISSVITSLGILFPFLWLLTPVGLGLFIYILWSRTHSFKQAATLGFLFGASTGGAGIGWFWSALPLTWLAGDAVSTQILAVGVAWLVVVFAFGVGTSLVTPLIWYTRNNIFAPLLVPGIWMITEIARMWGFSLINYGPESLVGAHFSGAALGYALAENPFLLQFAQFGGIHALDFLVGALATLIAILIGVCTKKATPAPYTIPFLCLGILVPLIFLQTPRRDAGAPVTVHLISTYIPIDSRDAKNDTLLASLLRSTSSTSTMATIVVLPEQSTANTLLPSKAGARDALKKLFPNNDTLIISASHVPTGTGNLYSELSYTSSDQGELAVYNKLFLMPIGEYIPSLSAAEFSLLSNQRIQNYMDSTRSALKRGSDVTAVTWRGLTIGGLVCSDNQSPILYRTIENRFHAGVLVNVSNTSWFHTSRFLFTKNVQLAKVHAVQNNAYYLSANNMAPAFVVSPRGAIIAQSTWNETGVLNIEIYPE